MTDQELYDYWYARGVSTSATFHAILDRTTHGEDAFLTACIEAANVEGDIETDAFISGTFHNCCAWRFGKPIAEKS